LLGVHFSKVSVAGLHDGPWLRTAQRTFAGSLAQRLASGRYAGLPRGVRMVARAVRAGAFRPGPADGSLDLLDTVEPLATMLGGTEPGEIEPRTLRGNLRSLPAAVWILAGGWF